MYFISQTIKGNKMIKRLAHTCFYTKKPKEIIDFYCNKIGLKLSFSIKDDNNNDVGWYFEVGNMTFLEFFDATFAEVEWNDYIKDMGRTGNMRHICFEVDSIEKIQGELKKKGVEVFDISIGSDKAKQGWIIDPEDNWIELMEYTDQSLQIKSDN